MERPLIYRAKNLNIESYIHRVFGTQYSIEKIETSTNQDQNTEEQ